MDLLCIRLARLTEAILMSTHNVRFYGELAKIVLQLSLNTLLICSSAFLHRLQCLITVQPGKRSW